MLLGSFLSESLNVLSKYISFCESARLEGVNWFIAKQFGCVCSLSSDPENCVAIKKRYLFIKKCTNLSACLVRNLCTISVQFNLRLRF